MSGFLDEVAGKIRRDEPVHPFIAAVLSAATPAVRLGMWLRLARTPVRVDARIISFGNVTAGGSGKTPAVIECARRELAAGEKVAILTRGYGAARAQFPIVADAVAPVAHLGDEPALMLRKLPGVVVVRDPDRVRGARAAIARGCRTLILDDGYQHVRLARDENILVIDGTNPFGNGRLIPRGILREPLAAIVRATAVIVTRCDQATGLDALLARLGSLAPNIPIRLTRHAPGDPWRLRDGATMPLEALRGMRARAVCAIGTPEAFYRTLESLGVLMDERLAFRDHAGIPAEALAGRAMTITTEKDAARIRTTTGNVWALPVELQDI